MNEELNKKFKLILFLVLSFSLLFLSGCSEKKAEDPSPVEELKLELTLEELKEFNGKDGKAAYIAVDGVIYDVSNSSRWRNGEHNDFLAGNDLTEGIKNVSPHGIKVLERMPVVGKIVEKK